MDKYGRSHIGKLYGQFVMPQSEMDNLPNKVKDNLSVVEVELRIPYGLWKNKELVRIDIPSPKLHDYRIP